jgi:hypothetical protein
VFDNLESFLLKKASDSSSPAIVEKLANGLVVDILSEMQGSGQDLTGVMRKNLSHIYRPVVVSGGHSIGVGRGGSEDKKAPSGTIAEFLNDPAYSKYRSVFATRGKHAWWNLPVKARNALAMERARGRFGGEVGESPYYYLQEEGKSDVKIKSRHFIGNAIQDFELRVRNIMLEMFNA